MRTIIITDQAYQALRAKASHVFDGTRDRQLPLGMWVVPIDDEVHSTISRFKRPHESVSDALLRLCGGSPN